jgi:hypothetical protein
MSHRHHHLVTLAFALSSALAASSAHACATCGCSLSTDAATGYSTATGWRVNLQYDFLDQSQLRYGNHAISASTVAAINDAGGDQEVEHDTVNRYTTLSVGFAPREDWNFKLFVPYIDRGHSTYGSGTNPLTADQISTAKVTGLGDIRFMTTFQGLTGDNDVGLQLGIKLPTGHYGGPNADGTGPSGNQPTTFRSGPLSQNASPDNLLDTSLQAGTGTTDVILGAFYHHPIAAQVDAFVNGQFQAAFAQRLHTSGADFRPGNTATVSIGARYKPSADWAPQIQVNISHKGADQGALADTADSAGTVAYLSPGVTFSLTSKLQAFGFAQVPVYSHLVGYQLAPRFTASAGLSLGF